MPAGAPGDASSRSGTGFKTHIARVEVRHPKGNRHLHRHGFGHGLVRVTRGFHVLRECLCEKKRGKKKEILGGRGKEAWYMWLKTHNMVGPLPLACVRVEAGVACDRHAKQRKDYVVSPSRHTNNKYMQQRSLARNARRPPPPVSPCLLLPASSSPPPPPPSLLSSSRLSASPFLRTTLCCPMIASIAR